MSLLFEYIKKYKVSFLLSFVFISIAVIAQLKQPQIIAEIIGSIVEGDIDLITQQGILLIVIAGVGFVGGFVNTIIAAKIAQKTGSDLRRRVFDKVQTFSYSNIEKFQASNLVVRLVNDTQQAQTLIMIILQSLLRIPIMFVGSFILAMTVLPQLWWIVVLVMVLVIVSVGVAFSIMGPKFGRMQRLIEKINAIAKENFMGMRVVKSFVQEDAEITKFNEESDLLTKEIIGVGYVFSFLMPAFFLIMDGGVALIVLMAGFLAESDPSVIQSTIAFISYVVMIMMSLMIGGMMVSFSSRAFVSMARIKEVLDTEVDMHFVEDSKPITSGNIEFKDVSFIYHDVEETTLRNVSFTIEHGQTLGVVGATGSGKSTLGQLIARIFDPSSGSVHIDGIDLKGISQSSLRSEVSLVLQKPILFSGTIAENIRQGKKDATHEELRSAAAIAQALEFIENEPQGFESEVYQRGANFSGGQKQRISIARGLVNKPAVLILDDSTSALDAKSEKLVKEGLKAEMTNTTKVIVSQKISSIVHADKILVLHEGVLVDQGTHKELLERSDVYKEIYDTQKGKVTISDYEE